MIIIICKTTKFVRKLWRHSQNARITAVFSVMFCMPLTANRRADGNPGGIKSRARIRKRRGRGTAKSFRTVALLTIFGFFPLFVRKTNSFPISLLREHGNKTGISKLTNTTNSQSPNKRYQNTEHHNKEQLIYIALHYITTRRR